jgi:acyl carrier protein
MTAPSRASSPTNARRTDAFEPFRRAALHDSLVARFACQVARHGDRLAVKMGEHALTYADLDRAANRIAHAMLDSFFDLGGHSLMAARMMESVERAVGRRVPITTLFRVPTIEHLVANLRDAVSLEPPLIALQPGGHRLPFFFFVHGDFSGGGFFSRALADALGPDRPFYAVHPHGLVDAAVPDSIEAMAADRLAALRAVKPHGPYLLGGHCNGALVALEMARLLVAQGEQHDQRHRLTTRRRRAARCASPPLSRRRPTRCSASRRRPAENACCAGARGSAR